nr:anti-sigma factor domain-containing protein [Paenibacillus pasadenensis]
MEVKKGKLIVLTPDGRFRKVKSRGGEQTGEEVSLSAPERQRVSRHIWWLPAATAAMALIIAIPIFLSERAEARPVVAVISMDINPSFEIGVDDKLAVRSLRAVNADAIPIVEGMDYDGEPVSGLLHYLAGELAERSYLDDGTANVLLAGVKLDGADQEVLSRLESEAKKAFDAAASVEGHAGIKITELESTPAVMEEASELGLSIGGMTVYLLAKDKGYSVSLEQFRMQPLQAASKWQGGVDLLVNDGTSLDPDKLNQLAEEEKRDRAANATGAHQPTPQPSASANKQQAAGQEDGRPSASPTVKPSIDKPSGTATKSPSSTRPPVPQASIVKSKPSPSASAKPHNNGHTNGRDRDDDWKDKWDDDEDWDDHWDRDKSEWLREKEQLIEKLRKEAEQARKELERKKLEAEERLKEAEQKLKNDTEQKKHEKNDNSRKEDDDHDAYKNKNRDDDDRYDEDRDQDDDDHHHNRDRDDRNDDDDDEDDETD